MILYRKLSWTPPTHTLHTFMDYILSQLSRVTRHVPLVPQPETKTWLDDGWNGNANGNDSGAGGGVSQYQRND
jgi:hypothetical protein